MTTRQQFNTYLWNLFYITMFIIIIITTTVTTTSKIVAIENDYPMNFLTKSLNRVMNLSSAIYEMKFPTTQFIPRLLRHKLQQQINNASMTTIIIPTGMEATLSTINAEDEVEDNGEGQDENMEMATTAITMEEVPMLPTTFMPTEFTPTTITTASLSTTSVLPSPSSSTSAPSTTYTTRKPFPSIVIPTLTSTNPNTVSIMKPSSSLFLPFNLKQKLKNFFFTITKNRPTSKGFLSLFEIIKFENKPCLVAIANIRSMEGICYHELECRNLGGFATERCANGAGVCCIFLTGCGDTTSQLITYFESSNYPKPVQEMLVCVLIINLKENIQQLRLDFIVFELNRPLDGDCLDDQFIISGHDINFQIPILCGINSGQHLYVHTKNSLSNKVYITISSKTTLGSRLFNIKITQLEQNVAPEGCLQYFVEPEGILKSFNYDIIGTVVHNREATYLNNLNYVICIKRLKNYCTITYKMEQDPYISNSDGNTNSNGQIDFQIVNKDEDGNDLVPNGQAGAGIFNCPDDFIAINQVRLCGERFNDGAVNDDFTMNSIIRDVTAGPIVMPFRTNHLYVGRGFRLVYKQELCI